MAKELYDFQAKKLHETQDAILLEIWVIGKGEEKVWFPKSMIEDHGDGTFTTPMYWASEKGII